MVVDRPRHDTLETDRLFHALADATRRDIVTKTLGKERSISELARLYPMSFAAVQKHVTVLAESGLVSKQRRGREQLVRGEVGRVREARGLLDQLETAWRDRLDRFGAVLAEDAPSEPPDPTRRKKP